MLDGLEIIVKTLEDNTAIYKYLSVDSCLYMLCKNVLLFQKINEWPDQFEGYWLSFYKKNGLIKSNEDIEEYFGSCWSLESYEEYRHKTNKEINANRDIENHGNACMWQTYCPNGGVRIKTTIGDIKRVLTRKSINYIHGKVEYLTLYDFPSEYNKDDLLFYKSTSYHSENEYRFLIKHEKEKNILLIEPEDRVKNIIQEILVCPNSKQNQWKSKAIYNYIIDFWGDDKNILDKVKISNLYSMISRELREIGTI